MTNEVESTKGMLFLLRTSVNLYLPIIPHLVEDEAATARIQAKGGLESYACNLYNSITDEKLASKF